MKRPSEAPGKTGARRRPVPSSRHLASPVWPCALLLTLSGCVAGPDPTDRAPNAADAYIHSVEQQARNAVSPTQVYWAHPPSADDTRAGESRTWNWSAPVRVAEPSASEGGGASGMGDDGEDPGGLPRGG